jgi:hypothetical protein
MKPKFFLLLLLTLLIVNSSLLITHATVRFVSKSGTSTPPYTSWETAADSIQKCINICLDGDTVYVANGVYKEFLVINPSIFLFGSSMDSTIIDGTGLTSPTIYALNDLTISGFNVIGNGNISDQNVKVITTTTFNLELSNCMIKNAYDGIFIGRSSGTIDNVIITNVNTGIFTFCGYDTCKPVIKNSIILVRPNGDNGIINFQGGQPTILNNIIIAMGYANSGIENAIPIYRWTVSNNLISGFNRNLENRFINDSSFLYNNISRDYVQGFSDYAAINNVNSTTVLKGNIITNNYIGVSVFSTPTADYNLYWDNQINATNGSVFGDGDVFADPMFVKDSVGRTLEYDYHLQKYSPAIDAGDPSILDVDGSRSDIGMFGGPFGESYTYQDLPPKAPKNFQASYDSGVVAIRWDKNSAADFSYYNIYRSTINNFEPDSTNYYSIVDTAFFRDTTTITNGKLYYRITAVDSCGNESVPGEQITVTITGIDEGEVEIVGEYKLYQNYPNPFNPTTIIPFKLKERSYVKVMVYDIKSEMLSVLVNETKEAGYYEAEFNGSNFASGIYLYRIEVIGQGTIPVYMEMKKMVLVK